MTNVMLMSDARAARFAAVQEQERRNARGHKPLPTDFATGQWSVAAGNAKATVTVTAMPANAEAIMYRVNYGTWQNAGRATTGAFDISGLTNGVQYAIQLRAFNSIGGSDGSTVKTVTPTA